MFYRNSITLLLADGIGFLLALGISSILARLISEAWLDRAFIGVGNPDTGQQIVLFVLLAAGGIIFFMHKEHYHRRAPWWQQVGHIISFCLFALLIEGFINYALKTPVTRLWVGLSWITAIPAVMIMRWVARAILTNQGVWEIPVILMGGPVNATETLHALKSESYLRHKIRYAVFPEVDAAAVAEFQKIHGDIEIRDNPDDIGPTDMVILCPDYGQTLQMKRTIDDIMAVGAKYSVVPPLEGFSFYGMQPSFFFGYNVVSLRPYHRLKTVGGRIAKNAVDCTGALVALVLFSPLFYFIARKVKQDGGPAFYSQKRIGQDGKPFRCWKFRSMVVNADEVLKELLAKDPQARQEWEKDFKLKNDPRITRIGNFLRKTSLDEIPQILNVLRGEMSLVGPRPIVEEEKKYYGDKFDDYAAVRPGITGLWQVSGRNDITYEQRVYLDSWYVRHWSVWNDIVIILKTFFVVLGRRGAY